MKPFLQYGPYIAIDFETSAYGGPCACAVGMVRMENLEVVDSFYALIRPPSSRICFTNIHGLTWQILKNERPFAQVWPEMAAFMAGARYFIAHNARFDQGVLMRCCAANSIPVPSRPFLCTLKGARAGLKLRNNGLAALCAHFEIELDHHNAASDARACGLLHARLIKMGISDKQMLLSPARRMAQVA